MKQLHSFRTSPKIIFKTLVSRKLLTAHFLKKLKSDSKIKQLIGGHQKPTAWS